MKYTITDYANVVFIAVVALTLFTFALQVPFSLFGSVTVTTPSSVIVSWYYVVTLTIIGALMPKSEKENLRYISVFCEVIMTLLSLASSILALQQHQNIPAVISFLVFVFGIIKTIVDLKRKE
jgi:glucan phosphoethanolaminetransferase (alkaline phosphatase superfamily)